MDMGHLITKLATLAQEAELFSSSIAITSIRVSPISRWRRERLMRIQMALQTQLTGQIRQQNAMPVEVPLQTKVAIRKAFTQIRFPELHKLQAEQLLRELALAQLTLWRSSHVTMPKPLQLARRFTLRVAPITTQTHQRVVRRLPTGSFPHIPRW